MSAESARAWYAANKERKRLADAQYRALNRERYAQYQRHLDRRKRRRCKCGCGRVLPEDSNPSRVRLFYSQECANKYNGELRQHVRKRKGRVCACGRPAAPGSWFCSEDCLLAVQWAVCELLVG
jgi:hypothetical protein